MKTDNYFLIIISLFLLVRVYAIPWPVDSQNTAHATNKTYGDWNGYQVDTTSCLGFHGGVDIPADSGTPVYAVIDGVVSNIRSDIGGDQGFINISADNISALAWHYGHIHLDTTTYNEGDSVHVGDSLGCIARFQGFDNNHLHFQRSNNDYTHLTGFCNPLDSLTSSPSQTPFILDRPPGETGWYILCEL
jgi:murein DD-endopeptidase MepM/ murein hydrolase activator NlpD